MDPMSFWTTPLGWFLATTGAVLLVTVGVLIAVAYGWGLWRTLKRLRAPATSEDRQP